MGHFALQVEASLLYARRFEIVSKGGNARLRELLQARRRQASGRVKRTTNQRTGILRKNLMIVEVIIVQEEKIWG